ncbi:DUF5666 domain-containing protein [Ruegeria hyattellae]|uniref:DUF5666 domain-containing protein n=1 Tax=Ruegeria hyattellae TaxID=3233337 RepID=UPI00355B77E8
MTTFSRAIAVTLAIWLCAPAGAQDGEEREGGIIGTGIVGTITQLGSVFVNNLRIEVSDGMQVVGSVPAMTAADLRPGHTVAIITERQDDGWHARHIRKVLPVVGKVTALGDGEIAVLGTRVDLGGQSTDLRVGDWVAVSGLWQEQRVRASRIERLAGTAHRARLSGTYLGPDPTGNTVIGGSLVSGIDPQHLQPGDLVRVYGQPTPDGIEALRLETGLFDETVGLIQVQGYYSRPQPDGLYTVLGSGLVSYTDRPEMISPDDRVIRCGQQGRLRVEQATGAAETEQVAHLLTELSC